MAGRQRTQFTDDQTQVLEEAFKVCHYPTTEEKKSLARQLELCENRITVWFQNRRAKQRRHDRKGTDVALSKPLFTIKTAPLPEKQSLKPPPNSPLTPTPEVVYELQFDPCNHHEYSDSQNQQPSFVETQNGGYVECCQLTCQELPCYDPAPSQYDYAFRDSHPIGISQSLPPISSYFPNYSQENYNPEFDQGFFYESNSSCQWFYDEQNYYQ